MEPIKFDKQLYKGRPQSVSTRLEKEIRTYDLLDSLNIAYERIDHEATNTIESCLEVEQSLGIHICKNLFLCNTQKTRFFLLMMPGNKKFKTAIFSKQMGCSRLSFADNESMEELLDISPGSVSVLGLMNDKSNKVQLVIDQDVLKEDFIGCHPCINTSSLRISTNDLLKKILPAIHHDYITAELPYTD